MNLKPSFCNLYLFIILGEGRNHERRIYLVYDGIHYDALVWNLAPEANNKGIFHILLSLSP